MKPLPTFTHQLRVARTDRPHTIRLYDKQRELISESVNPGIPRSKGDIPLPVFVPADAAFVEVEGDVQVVGVRDLCEAL